MKKSLIFLLALTLCFGLGLTTMALADVQIDKGQQRSTAAVKFFVARNGRSFDVGAGGWMNNGNVISSGYAVVWDTVSDDGVSIAYTGTSHDARVAGIAMDNITGSSRDYNAASDDGYANWGRVQCWGRYSAAQYDGSGVVDAAGGDAVSGSRVSTSVVPGRLGQYAEVDGLGGAAAEHSANTSRDSAGIALDASSAGASTMDVFLQLC